MLRACLPGDQESIRALFTDPDVRRHLGGPLTPADAEARVQIAGERWGHFAVVRPEVGLIGTLSFAKKRGPWEVSYQFARSQWGQGYGREALLAALRWFFVVTAEASVIALTQEGNERSTRLLESIGGVVVGRPEYKGEPQLEFLIRQDVV